MNTVSHQPKPARITKRRIARLAALVFAALVASPSYAGFTVSVVKLNSYQGAASTKFVFVSDGIGAGCPGAALSYDGSGDGGKALYALLLAAFVSGKKVELNVSGTPVTTGVCTSGNGCTLLEGYIKEFS